MKRIEFISPVAAIRGNMSGTQLLKYPLHDNRAFEGPDGSVNYARNYRPSFIGSKRALDGRCSFQTKRKSANHLTAKAKSAMANLGGVGAIYSALVRDKMSNVYVNAKGCYDDAVAGGYSGTFRKYMYGFIKPALDAKEATIDITTPDHRVVIDNPFVKTGVSNITINNASIVKFWPILADNPVIRYIEGVSTPIICHENDTFGDVMKSCYNVLGLSLSNEGEIEYANMIVCEDGRGTPMNPTIPVETYNGYILLTF